jgi:hypothetical protein
VGVEPEASDARFEGRDSPLCGSRNSHWCIDVLEAEECCMGRANIRHGFPSAPALSGRRCECVAARDERLHDVRTQDCGRFNFEEVAINKDEVGIETGE